MSTMKAIKDFTLGKKRYTIDEEFEVDDQNIAFAFEFKNLARYKDRELKTSNNRMLRSEIRSDKHKSKPRGRPRKQNQE